MRQFSSPRVKGLEFTMYDDGSGYAEYKGKKVGEIDKSTNEIRIKGDQWCTFNDTDLEKEFITKAENFVSQYESYYSSKVDGLTVIVSNDGCATVTYKGKEIGKSSFYDDYTNKIAQYEINLNGEKEHYHLIGNLKDLVMERVENYVLNNKNLFDLKIAELSPYFVEDKKATVQLDETTAEFLVNKSPKLKQVFEDNGYDNYMNFFEDNRGDAFIDANDLSNIGITVVINDDIEYPIPLSTAEKAILRDRLDEEVKRINKEKLEDKDGDHIPDKIDSTFSPDGFRTQTDIDHDKNNDDEYRKALVTTDEYKQLQANGFKCQKAKVTADDGRIPIRYKAADKERFEKIIHLGGKHGGLCI